MRKKITSFISVIKKVLLFAGLIWVSGSCDKVDAFDCFTSTGTIVKESRQVDDFHRIILKDNVNLVLRKSDENSLVIEAGKNLLKKINTGVNENGVLEISNTNRCNWVRSYDKPITAYLGFKTLDTLTYRSIGDVTNEDTLRLDTLLVEVKEGAGNIALVVDAYKLMTYHHYGTADIVTSGKASLSINYMASFGRIDNRALYAHHVYLNNKSSNDMYVRALSILGATIENIGNVYYYGEPQQTTLERLGSGELIKLGD